MKTLSLTLLVALVLAAPAAAQTTPEIPTSWKVDFFAQGVNPTTGQPVQSNTFAAGAFTCGQPPVAAPTGTVVNPGQIHWDDPSASGKTCGLTFNQTVTIFAIPIGNYVATVIGIGPTQGAGGRSAASNPFSHAIVLASPSVPTNVIVSP